MILQASVQLWRSQPENGSVRPKKTQKKADRGSG